TTRSHSNPFMRPSPRSALFPYTTLFRSKSIAERFKLLSKVLHSILITSNSIGIYQGSQSLLIPKEQYIESSESLKVGQTPIDLWIYIGLRKSEEGNSLYTYGLNEFEKSEMEIIN